MTDDIVARLRAPAKADVPIRICRLMDEAADTIEYERALRAQAEQEHTDMTWQRRRADERVESAEARVRELEAEVDALRHDLERQMTIANAECNRAETAEARLSTIEAGAIERCTTVALVPVEATGQIKSAISAFVRSRAIPSPSDLDPDDIYFDNGDAGELYEDIVSAARTGGEA